MRDAVRDLLGDDRLLFFWACVDSVKMGELRTGSIVIGEGGYAGFRGIMSLPPLSTTHSVEGQFKR